MNPYLKFVEGFRELFTSAKGIRVSGKTEPVQSGPKVLLFSPHPDDECVTGLLSLRLMREAGMQIINIPVTFGSNPDRRAARAEELKNACAYLGWKIFQGSENYQPLDVAATVSALNKFQPEIIFLPHSKDWNSRHVETHHLVMNALAEMPTDFACTVIETEFWGAMENPNLMVEGDAQSVADLVAALSLHTGEVARNPYHLMLPAWMMDNVRRGGELVGGQGTAAPEFTFATLYSLSRWEKGRLSKPLEKGWVLACAENAGELLDFPKGKR